jgi:hypothetical protein
LEDDEVALAEDVTVVVVVVVGTETDVEEAVAEDVVGATSA